MPKDTVTMKEAAAILGVSPVKMWQLVREGSLRARANPLDRREKLVDTADLERLRNRHQELRRPRPRSIGIVNDPDLQSEHAEEWLEANWHPC